MVHRERSRGQYRGAEYLLAKLVAELPLDASFAAAFGLGLKRRCGLRAPAARLAESVGLAHAPQRAIAAAQATGAASGARPQPAAKMEESRLSTSRRLRSSGSSR